MWQLTPARIKHFYQIRIVFICEKVGSRGRFLRSDSFFITQPYQKQPVRKLPRAIRDRNKIGSQIEDHQGLLEVNMNLLLYRITMQEYP